MADGAGQGMPREVPSEELDRPVLELHDQLPRDVRQKLAQVADEVKRLTESSTAEDPVTPPSSADQAVVRREEETATAEAKQSSGELQAQGAVVTSLSDRPTLKDVVCFAEPRVAPKWYDLGLALDIKPFVLDGVAHQQEKADRPREMFAKWLEASPGTGSQPRTWQTVLDAVRMICGPAVMEDIRTAVQTPRIPAAGDLEESKTTEHSSAIELSQGHRRLFTTSSDDLVPQQSVAMRSLPDYTSIKMDLLAQDISDLCSESDPEVVIKLLYGNTLATISDLLKPHLKEVKKVAVRYHRLGLHYMAVGENIIESADSIDNLMSQMSVTRMWDNTRFLRKAITSIPHSAPERSVAEAILLHYDLHLAIYKRATLLKDALTKESQSKEEVEASTAANKLVPLKITSPKPFDSFSCEDCYILQARGLKKAYGIPEEKIICHDVEERLTFKAPHPPSSPSPSSSMGGRPSLPSSVDTGDEGSETPSSAHLSYGPVHGIPNPKRRRLNPTVALPTGPAFLGPPQQTPVRGCQSSALRPAEDPTRNSVSFGHDVFLTICTGVLLQSHHLLSHHPTLPAVPHPAPPWEAALHCRHQWTLVMRATSGIQPAASWPDVAFC